MHYVEEDFWPHNTSLWVTSFRGNAPKFVFYVLQFVGLERFATGSGVPTLNRNDVHSHRIEIPSSSEEQQAIATVLSDMDAEIAALEQKLAKTRALNRGMMQELLTGPDAVAAGRGRLAVGTQLVRLEADRPSRSAPAQLGSNRVAGLSPR